MQYLLIKQNKVKSESCTTLESCIKVVFRDLIDLKLNDQLLKIFFLIK